MVVLSAMREGWDLLLMPLTYQKTFPEMKHLSSRSCFVVGVAVTSALSSLVAAGTVVCGATACSGVSMVVAASRYMLVKKTRCFR